MCHCIDQGIAALGHHALCTCPVVGSLGDLELALGYFCKLDVLKYVKNECSMKILRSLLKARLSFL